MKKQSIIFFDGICNFCNSRIDYIIKKDSMSKYKYSSLQSEFAKEFLKEYNIKNEENDSLLLFENGCIYDKSEAVFQIAKHLKGNGPAILSFFNFLPRFISDFVYMLVAKVRYSLAGKRKTCRLPSKEEMGLFLQ